MGGKKAGGGFLGIGGKSGFLNTGLFGTGPDKLKGFDVSGAASSGEEEMLARQRAIASGEANNIAVDDANRATMATAASARGIANPMLAQRAAQNVMAEQGMAQMAQERRMADQMLAQQAAVQRGVSLQAQQANVGNTQAFQKAQLEGLSAVGQGAMAASGSGGGGKGAAAASSDENKKKDIKDAASAGDDIEKFVNALNGYNFKYKDPSAPGASEGEQMGIMAQDLEKSQTGAQAVTDTPNGKMVDYAKVVPALAAAIAEQNKKLKELEGK